MKNITLRNMDGKPHIDKIFIVLTPFHLKSFSEKYGNEIKKRNVLILKETYLEEKYWTDYEANIVNMPKNNFRIYDFFETPLMSIIRYRKRISEIKIFCIDLIEKIDFNQKVTINIGSDRDIFTQIFLNILYKNLPLNTLKLCAFDEGLGFYDNQVFFDKIKSFLFPIISPILFGERIYFNKPMGKDRRIDEVFCRFPKFIAKNGFSKYTILNVRENTQKGIYNPNSSRVLVFSFPLKDRNIPLSDKVKWLSSIYRRLEVEEFEVKLHPREDKFQLPDIPTIFFEGHFPIDELNYFDYKYIVNFNSSIVMDLLASGYPPDKIITISFGAKLNVSTLYNQTQYLSINEVLNED